MPTRIKASAVKRRVKRRSERASHNKKTNATLRSRKQRARKTARKVMRGGGGTPYYVSYYKINTPEGKEHKVKEFFINNDAKFEPLPKLLSKPILRLNFSKNMFGTSSYTLTIEFMLDELDTLAESFKLYGLDRVHDLLIPNIINGLLTTLFEYVLSGNENIPYTQKIGTDGKYKEPDFNVNRSTIFDSDSNLATGRLAVSRETHNQQYNDKCKPFLKESIKKDGVFSQPCVIEIKFEPNGETTVVRLMSYTTIVVKDHGCGLYYYKWGKSAAYPNGIYSFTVNKKFNDKNGFSLNDKNQLYVFPSYQIYGENVGNSQRYIFSFDEKKITDQINGIKTDEIRIRDQENTRKEQEKKRKEEEERKETERRNGLTEEERKAEDDAKAKREKDYDEKARSLSQNQDRWGYD